MTPPVSVSPSMGVRKMASMSMPVEVTSGIDSTTKVVPRKVFSWKFSNTWWKKVALNSSEPSKLVVLAPTSKLSTNSGRKLVSVTASRPVPPVGSPLEEMERSRL